MFVIQMQTASRGRERMNSYKKKDFEIKVDEDDGSHYWKLTGGGETKNHKNTDQDMSEKGGRIYFEENLVGFNSGQYLKDFMAKLSPDHKNLMQRPRRPGKEFKLLENPERWYVPSNFDYGNKIIANI